MGGSRSPRVLQASAVAPKVQASGELCTRVQGMAACAVKQLAKCEAWLQACMHAKEKLMAWQSAKA